jgi:hypothetical protein
VIMKHTAYFIHVQSAMRFYVHLRRVSRLVQFDCSVVIEACNQSTLQCERRSATRFTASSTSRLPNHTLGAVTAQHSMQACIHTRVTLCAMYITSARIRASMQWLSCHHVSNDCHHNQILCYIETRISRPTIFLLAVKGEILRYDRLESMFKTDAYIRLLQILK